MPIRLNGRREKLSPRGLMRATLAVFLISPFLIWLAWIKTWTVPSADLVFEFVWAISLALCGAAMGTLGGLLFGMACLGSRAPRVLDLCLLGPSFVPPLFLSLAMMSLGPWASGYGVVILLHALIAGGLVAVAFTRLCENQVGRQVEAARVMGARPLQIWIGLAWPQLRGDIGVLAFMAMILCLGSFSIPQMLGGSGFKTLETMTYDLIRVRGAWDQAVLMGVVILFGLMGFAPTRPPEITAPKNVDLKFLRIPYLRYLVPVPLFLLTAFLFRSTTGTFDPDTLGALVPAVTLSLALGLMVGLTHLILFIGIAFVLPHARLDRLLVGLIAPGAVLSAFSYLLLPGSPYLKFTAVTCVVTLPLLYRWQVRPALNRLSGQIEIARSLGAGWSQILFGLVWPQAGSSMMRAAGLAGAWASGEHALSGILLEDGEALPLLAINLIGHYQLGSAILCLVPMAVVAVIVYQAFAGSVRFVVS